jgi:hypothetical protein
MVPLGPIFMPVEQCNIQRDLSAQVLKGKVFWRTNSNLIARHVYKQPLQKKTLNHGCTFVALCLQKCLQNVGVEQKNRKAAWFELSSGAGWSKTKHGLLVADENSSKPTSPS